MIHFVHPEVFLLAVPGVAWLLRCGRGLAAEVQLLRGALLLALLAVLAEPFRATAIAGRDLVLLVDRSRSVGDLGWRRADELVQEAVAAAEPGDRIGVLAFGRGVAVEVPLTEASDFVLGAPRSSVDADATDLLAALDRAVATVPPGRQGSVLVISDGESTGAPAWPGARAALRRGVRVDTVPIRRPGGAEVAVEELELPAEVGAGEPLRITAWIQADRAVAAPFRLFRDGEVLTEGTVDLRPGSNRLRFRDRASAVGTHRYELVLDVPDDRVRENDRALGVVRVAGPRRILVVRSGGDPSGRLPSVLRGAGLGVEVVEPGRAPSSLGALDAFRAVVLENVPAADLPPGAMEALVTFVEDFGGGLWMTGGKASFGLGGYRLSPLEPVLPVSMEVREEQRRFALAMAIALDRSGSMSAPAGTGRTKMDLANLGTIAALQTLGPNDELAVLAVDSAPHVVVPLTRIDQGGDLAARIQSIESGGGGIFVYEALEAMARQLQSTATANRHMVLFADAADAEEPGAYRTFVPSMVDAGVTLSVIALGAPTDSDAALLLELARLGGGRCKFVEDVRQLPRLFAQETIEVARSSFVEEPIGVRVRPDLVGLGDVSIGALSASGIPPVGGHAIAWPEPRASIGLELDDETRTPLLTFWQRGLGRAAAYLGEVDGEFTGPIGGVAEFDELMATVGRW
ncbi:MAG: VWA domain-containing protein, partial [Planctomycetota bacterium]|nr:VWA domain-containing protein [Planctomycetota bacterium]